MQRMYVPSKWLAEFMDNKSSRYYRYTRFPLTDDDIRNNDIKAFSSQYRSIDDLRGLYTYYRDILTAHASCAYPALADESLESRERLVRELLKMEPGVKMLRYRSYLMVNPNEPDSRDTFDMFLECHDSVCFDHIGFEPAGEEPVPVDEPAYAGISTARLNRMRS